MRQKTKTPEIKTLKKKNKAKLVALELMENFLNTFHRS